MIDLTNKLWVEPTKGKDTVSAEAKFCWSILTFIKRLTDYLLALAKILKLTPDYLDKIKKKKRPVKDHFYKKEKSPFSNGGPKIEFAYHQNSINILPITITVSWHEHFIDKSRRPKAVEGSDAVEHSGHGQWLWLSWQSGHFRRQRSAVRIQSSA